MAFARTYGAQTHFLEARLVSVEVDISKGLHSFSIVGLPNKAVEEARDRVSAALKNCGFKSPKQTNSKITVSLAPANLKKEGPSFDLAIAIGYLLASGSIACDPEGRIFAGELSLDGRIRPIHGVLSYAHMAMSHHIRELYVPKENATEAAMIPGLKVFPLSHLRELIDHLEGRISLKTAEPEFHDEGKETSITELDDIVGNETAKRGLIIAAAGGHNIALFGPPGTGKTMLARAFQGLLPSLTPKESLEVTSIYSTTGNLKGSIIRTPQMRAPHHNASRTAVIGGGPIPKPGEATLAHRGILFMDEFPEFSRETIESLRQPMEERSVVISRTNLSCRFPSHFILIVAFNPCPCGHHGSAGKTCLCTPRDRARYHNKISGPIIDRIDLWIEVSKIDHARLTYRKNSDSETIRGRKTVALARKAQEQRYEKEGKLNSDAVIRDSIDAMKLSGAANDILKKAGEADGMSGRGYHRIIRLSRTIADIEGTEQIETRHVLEALQYRKKG